MCRSQRAYGAVPAAVELESQEIESFAAELIDRFGPLPEEVEHL